MVCCDGGEGGQLLQPRTMHPPSTLLTPQYHKPPGVHHCSTWWVAGVWACQPHRCSAPHSHLPHRHSAFIISLIEGVVQNHGVLMYLGQWIPHTFMSTFLLCPSSCTAKSVWSTWTITGEQGRLHGPVGAPVAGSGKGSLSTRMYAAGGP